MKVKEKTKKEIIVEEAAKLFRDKGYKATSVRDLAQQVGLEASSLYNHIKSKEELLQKICFQNARRFLNGIKAVEEADLNITEKVEALIRLHVQIAAEDITSVTVFNDEWRHLSEPSLSEFLEMRRDYENRFKSIIQTGIEAGLFKALHPTIVLNTILTSTRWIHYWYKPDRGISEQELENNILQLLLEGLIK